MTAPEVLIVDDDTDIRDVIAIVLESQGYRTSLAADGAQALDRLRRAPPPDLLLIDLMMPGVSGMEVVQTLKLEPELAQIPIVVIPGDGSARASCTAIGADRLLVKPVDIDELLAVVGRYTRRAA